MAWLNDSFYAFFYKNHKALKKGNYFSLKKVAHTTSSV